MLTTVARHTFAAIGWVFLTVYGWLNRPEPHGPLSPEEEEWQQSRMAAGGW